MNRTKYWISALMCFTYMACSNVPQPCDPEFLASQQIVMGGVCREHAEKTCPGYSRMAEDEKLQCPGVLECLDKIQKAEDDCHGK
jgi:hypothetical protein